MYDVIVVGGGHAGIEAALAPARMNQKTVLITSNFNNVGSLPCNTSIQQRDLEYNLYELRLINKLILDI